MYYHKLSLRS